MPKLRTKKSVQKRFSITKNGKVKRNKAFSNHILTKKSRERKRKYRQSVVAHPSNSKNIKMMLPYAQYSFRKSLHCVRTCRTTQWWNRLSLTHTIMK